MSKQAKTTTQQNSMYELISGKIGRRGADGVYRVHTAPYRFVPTASELAGNKDRLVLIGEREVSPSDGEAISDLPMMKAKSLVAKVTKESVLDAMFKQESSRRPPRKGVLKMIEERRLDIKQVPEGYATRKSLENIIDLETEESLGKTQAMTKDELAS